MTTGTQQINLYVAELRPRRDVLSAGRAALLIVLLVVVAALFVSWEQWRQTQLSRELAQIEARIQTQAPRVEALEQEAASRATDAALLREAGNREEQAAQTLQLLAFMEQVTLGNMVGYSEHLKDLSRASFQGIWLTDISLEGDANSVSLQGFVTSPAMLPDYVSRLGGGRSTLSSRSFHRLTTSRAPDDSGNHAFELEASL